MPEGIKTEIKRKALHLTGLTVPAFYVLFGRELTLTFVAFAFVLFVVLEPFRIIEELRDRIKVRLKIISPEMVNGVEVIEKHIKDIERSHERNGIGAHVYFSLASLVIVYFFSGKIAIAAITVATIGDALAAIVGKSFGRHRFSNGKSLEGSLAYFISGVIVIAPLMGLVAAVVGSLAGTIVEFYELPPDDNFSNQLAIAVTLYLLTFL
ncbi:diacylglycerol/polyprenol kinase family protein [Thermococcus gorgonarius]|uniref:Phosphatidate cytidylyltransferase n=1 Tax=Thermococcus gorgonarius TaxID=71997 RepID=A0A2Z2M808_THEGO|nr:diacylglycerol/polyprenol kinase family protein [Thermococcus gorgonarius]ASI99983.1 phosphatidate cytidylyltransferase [Thermococcus gorgonarius]